MRQWCMCELKVQQFCLVLSFPLCRRFGSSNVRGHAPLELLPQTPAKEPVCDSEHGSTGKRKQGAQSDKRPECATELTVKTHPR